MGERPICLEEEMHWGRNGFRSYGETHYSEEYDQNQRGNSGYEEQRPWYKEEDTSLKDMLKDYIRTRTTFDDWFDDSFKVINNRIEQIEQEERNHQAWIQDLDRRLDIMVADFENQLPVDLPSYAQPNPRTGKTNQSNPTHENNIRGNQGGRGEQVNAIYTRSGFRYGDEEERNGNKTEKIAELGTTAPQSYPLRRSGSPNEHFPVFANQYSSPQYGRMSCSEPASDSDEEEEEEIEIEKLPENETMVKNEELDEKAEVSSNKDDTVESEDDEIGILAGALENIVKQSQLEIIELHHTVNRLREESILLKEHAEAQAKELLQRKDQVEELKEKERVSNENVEGLTLGIVAAEEEITRWKVAAQQEAEARKAMEQEYVSQLSQLADTRGARLRKELDEEQKEKNLDVELEEFLEMSIEEASNRDCNDYGNLTLEEIERIFDLSTEPIATKKENKVEGKERLEPEMEFEREPMGVHEVVLQGMNDKEDEFLNFDDFTYGKPIERDKYGGKEGALKQWKNSMIMRETKEWNDAWAKTRMILIVSTYGIPCDDVICRDVGEREVFGKLNGEGNWGKSRSPSLFVS